LTASDGERALEILRQHRDTIALVILDMTMPGMNGRKTFESMRKLSPDTKVLLCTGYAIDSQAQNIMAQGCSGFIQKPFDAAAFSAMVGKILSSDSTPNSGLREHFASIATILER